MMLQHKIRDTQLERDQVLQNLGKVSSEPCRGTETLIAMREDESPGAGDLDSRFDRAMMPTDLGPLVQTQPNMPHFIL